MIDVTLLGTAALMPLPDRGLTAAFLECGGRAVLFDCGEGTQTAIRREKLNPMKIDLIALTHYHGDHLFGLPGLLQSLHVMERERPLYITGPEPLMEMIRPVAQLTGGTCFPIMAAQIPPEGVSMQAFDPAWPEKARLTPFPTKHRSPSQGYCFTLDRAGKFLPEKARALNVPVTEWGRLQKGEEVETPEGIVRPEQVTGPPRKGLKFVFSGDTAECPALTEAARGADLAILEGTFGDPAHEEAADRYGHMTFGRAARTAAEAGVRKLWLAHFSQRMDDPADYLSHAEAFFPGTVLGRDGMRTTLAFEKD